MGSGLAALGGGKGIGALLGGAGTALGALGAGGQSQQQFVSQMHPTQLKAALNLLAGGGGASISGQKKALNAVNAGYAGAQKNLALGASNAKQTVLDQQTQALGAQNAAGVASGTSGFSTNKQGIGQIYGNTAKTLADIDNTIAQQQAELSIGAGQAKAQGLGNIGQAYSDLATNQANAVANTVHKDHYDALGNLLHPKKKKPSAMAAYKSVNANPSLGGV